MDAMNWLDIALVCLAVAGFLKGWRDGFVRQAVSLLAFAAAIYLCSEVAASLREYLAGKEWFSAQTVTMASYILAFLLIAGVVFLAGSLIHKMISVTPLGLFNHLAGSLVGLVITALLLSLSLNLLETMDADSKLIPRETKMESRLYFRFKEFVPAVYPSELFILRFPDGMDEGRLN
jgi:membrane protein required for colicin V production